MSGFTAVTVGPGLIDQHSGVLFFDATKNRLQFMHLAWHRILRCEDHQLNDYGYVVADTTQIDDEIIAATCLNLETEHGAGGINYALDYSAKLFQAGAIEYLHPYGGLSCTTFVLAAFAAAGIQLIDDTEWPRRAEDAEIQARLVAELRSNSTASMEHIEAQEKLVGKAKRYRPTEVAAAAYLAENGPVTFKELEALSLEILQAYNQVFAMA